jgi:hypothetical protein
MEIRPVKEREKPKYPKKDEIDIEEVKRSIPKRWASSPAAKIALGTLAAVSLAGCVPQVPAGSPAPPSATTEETTSTVETYHLEGIVAAPTVNVAPLFIHGNGRGAFGGDMASMPAFLSEEEALAMINEAASGYGLKFSIIDGAEFYNVLQPVTDLNPPSIDGEGPAPADTFITLKPDFTDSEHGIAIEFITREDVSQWSLRRSISTVEVYDTKDTAAQLSESLENVSADRLYTAAVLYDPCDYSDSDAEARALSEEDVKAQAKDFFEWLKQQGII